MEPKKQTKTNEQSENQLIDRENKQGCQTGGSGSWVKREKGLRSTDWQSQNSHVDVKYSLGNRVDDVVITASGARWVPCLLRGILHKVC